MRLDLAALESAYNSGITPASVIEYVYQQIEEVGLRPVWISLVPLKQAVERARQLADQDRSALPLYGVPFAVKDNIDVAGMETTAGCPAFSHAASKTATVVAMLEEAGAILVGKTNMDQFATGLVGTRTPYGACSSVFSEAHISGGSSSGSAVAVARGLVSFALGTDTAGSGRVPAAFNNLVGLKPTRGTLSTHGVLPACRSVDCVSIFALTCHDAKRVYEQARGFDPADIYSHPRSAENAVAPSLTGSFSFGIPAAAQLEFFGDEEAQALYLQSVRALEKLGGKAVEFDLTPFRAAAELLYAGPWVAERLAAIESFFQNHADDIHPVVRGIIAGAAAYSAVDCFNAQYRLHELRRNTAPTWNSLDVLLLPTAPTTYTISEVEADPVRLNSNLGYYTNFVNLLDLAAVAVPAGFRPSGLPFGVSLIAPAFTDLALLYLGDRLHRAMNNKVGGVATPLAETPALSSLIPPPGCTLLAVVGAHLTGQPLNSQLVSRGARMLQTTQTDGCYRLYALAGTVPPKPGLIRDPTFSGPGIEVEVWAFPTQQFGSFVASIPAPLGIGSLELRDGTRVSGFICEPYAVHTSQEITHLGGWRAHLETLAPKGAPAE